MVGAVSGKTFDVVNPAGDLKKVSLELGGKLPTIILLDADLDIAIAESASAIFFNHGQCCCAGSRLFAHKNVYDKVVAGVADVASKIRVGPGPATEMGPLVSSEQFDRVTGYIKSGRDQGASLAIASVAIGGDRGYFVAPTVFENTKPDMKIITEEIFARWSARGPFDNDDLDRLEAGDASFVVSLDGVRSACHSVTMSERPSEVETELRIGEVAVERPSRTDAGIFFIGTIHTPWLTRRDCPKRGSLDGPVCSIVVDDRWHPALTDIDEYRHIQVLYWMHQARRDLVLQTPFGKATTGTFALRSPVRPNPIASSIVRLVGVGGTTLQVRGLDCVDGTPLLDLKPDHPVAISQE
jgi:tRNA-Thr(GGU) m(6)t(6)A37 methyltransferase TsaA